MKQFRARMRSALGLRDFARARECLERVPADRGVTLRTQLERLEGLGDTAQARLLDMLRDTHPHLWAVAFKRVEPWEDKDVLWNTAEGIKRKTEERDHLVNVTMHENAKRIGEAASHGDLSENSEYKFALEERDLLRARMAQMNNELTLSGVIDAKAVPTDHVGVGSRVKLCDAATGQTRVMTFLGPFDADVEKGVYNYRAPMSLSLMGLRVSDTQKVTLDGQERELEVVEIANGLTDA
jgi:transcription elongation GreA/GreB family factor